MMEKLLELDGFEFIESLGSGGMSTVWKARQISLDREVAIKVLAPGFASTEEDVGRFIAEARTAGRLKHSGIVQVFDAVFTDGVYCFVMELVDGYTVGDWVRRKGRLTESEALAIAENVAEALDYAWEQFGMVHCDIKPDNVMIDSDGAVKLTDLGLSRTVRILSSDSTEPEDEVLGTPSYIAPEQAMGEPDLDCRADIYSLGAMLYHLVTGKMMFEEYPLEQVMDLQVTSHVPAIRSIARDISIPFENFVEKLLSKRRKYRHSDWKQVLADIRAVRMKRILPSGLPLLNASTMLPDPQRKAAALAKRKSIYSDISRKRDGNVIWRWVAVSLVLCAVLAGVWHFNKPQVKAGPQVSQHMRRHVALLLEEAEAFARSNPGDTQGIIARFGKVVDYLPNSTEASRARAMITLYTPRPGAAAPEAAVEARETGRTARSAPRPQAQGRQVAEVRGKASDSGHGSGGGAVKLSEEEELRLRIKAELDAAETHAKREREMEERRAREAKEQAD